MGVKALFQRKDGSLVDWLEVFSKERVSKEYIEMLAVAHSIDLIASMVAKAEIQVFRRDKKANQITEQFDDLYWRLNIQPNLNENGVYFKYKLVCKLLLEQKAIVVMNKIPQKVPYLYVADSYDTDNQILYGKTYKNITISDDEGNSLAVKKTYKQEEILKFSFFNEEMAKAVQNYKNEIGKLLNVTSKKYKKTNSEKWRVKNPGAQIMLKDLETGEDLNREKYLKKITGGLLEDDDSIFMLPEQLNLENLNKDRTSNLSDFKDIVKEIGDSTARRFKIPLDIFYGSKTEKSTGTNDFITFAIEPVFESLENGYTMGLIGEKDWLIGERLLFNRFTLQHKDIGDLATGLDKLRGMGYSHNDINRFLRLPLVDEEWANKHYITKNYGNMEGGETNGEVS